MGGLRQGKISWIIRINLPMADPNDTGPHVHVPRSLPRFHVSRHLQMILRVPKSQQVWNRMLDRRIITDG